MEYGFGIWGRKAVVAVAMAEVREAVAVVRVFMSVAMAKTRVFSTSSLTGSLRSGGSAIHRPSVLLSSE